jgi:hypothetical protein
MRAVAIVSAVLLCAFGMIVEVRAGILLPAWQPVSRTLVWIVVAYSGLGVVANAITPSRWERILWLPTVLVLLVTSVLIATS